MQHIRYIDAARQIYRCKKQNPIIQYTHIYIIMKQTLNPPIRTCHSCLRELPAEAFYVNRKTQVLDYCCKECRSAASKKRYMDSHSVNDTHMYPVITDIQDRILRMELILHARQVVNESMARKRRRLRETVCEES